MARYIDADDLYRRVKTKTNPYGKPTLDYESGVKVLDMIENTPTADVVPKSEVEKFAEEIKLEFYREFDEIIPSIMADKIDELKKKYTDTSPADPKEAFIQKLVDNWQWGEDSETEVKNNENQNKT